MEAPEKIFLHPDIGGREFLRPWLHRPANNESVEYTRTDAFIEKTCEWIERNFNMPNDFEQHFRKAMKGEQDYLAIMSEEDKAYIYDNVSKKVVK